jgi:redox-sensitive bicupin YhaK (pirin superfamily)
MIRKAFLAKEVSEGAGARVRRSIGTPQLRNFSPFLMLDHFNVKPGAGFPDHPHRKFFFEDKTCLFNN